ncbi:aspartate dehydrogenase [Thermotoga sp. KOL6]|uniref:aspartate dehydrogenase n=1 Tax=Thermotoga sp. KOL6 TaxID=126741 RepID=UPI000C774D2A|nr:aspartate dehydrogenase [Thermotoga sp. KOL6]PLV60304.1 aspartate dehydrogenase [Thermotoga sp. KOL6]
MKLLIIGMGNIGKQIFRMASFEKAYIFDKYQRLTLPNAYQLETFHIPPDVDTVIECASPEAVKELSFQILESKVNYLIISTSAFADKVFREKFFETLKHSPTKVFFPSGAIGGIDLISAIKDSVKQVHIETKKHPKNLELNIKGQTVVFDGSVEEAAKRFPRNINIASTVGLVVGFEKVKVRMIADSSISHNIHTIEVDSDVGRYEFKIENLPSPENPKTSIITVYSILRTLKNLESKIIFG